MTIATKTSSQITAAFQAYWEGLSAARGGDVPLRSDVDPTKIGPLLPYLGMLELTQRPDDAPDFKIRLLGQHVIDHIGLKLTGAWLGDVGLGSFEPLARSGVAQCMKERRPVHMLHDLSWRNRSHILGEICVAPLSSDGKALDFVFGAAHFQHY